MHLSPFGSISLSNNSSSAETSYPRTVCAEYDARVCSTFKNSVNSWFNTYSPMSSFFFSASKTPMSNQPLFSESSDSLAHQATQSFLREHIFSRIFFLPRAQLFNRFLLIQNPHSQIPSLTGAETDSSARKLRQTLPFLHIPHSFDDT